MTESAKFWDKHAEKYAASPIKDQESYDYTLRRTRSYLTTGDRVLELGCGTGSTALALADGVAEITGSDISPEMVRIARAKAEAAGQDNAAFRVATARGALEDAPDAILAFNLFHLVPDADRLFADIYATLPRGGFFISKTPCLAEPAIGLKRFAFRTMIPVMRLVGLAPPVRLFTFHELEGAIKAAGFDLLETGAFPEMSRYIVARKP